MTNTADPEGYEATTKLRGLEREVRSSKRMQAAAMDPEARAKATKRLNDYREKIREHVSSTPAKRQPWRESFGVSKKALGKTPLKTASLETRAATAAEKLKPFATAKEERDYVLRAGRSGQPLLGNPHRAAFLREVADAEGIDARTLKAYSQATDTFTTSVDVATPIRQAAAELAGRTVAEEYVTATTRAFKASANPAFVKLLEADRALAQAFLRRELGDVRSVTMYRGVVATTETQAAAIAKGTGSTIDVGVNAMSSWSLREDVARSFAVDAFGTAHAEAGAQGAVVAVKVPLSDILMTGDTVGAFWDTYGGVAGYEVMPMFRTATVDARVVWTGKVGDVVKDVRK